MLFLNKQFPSNLVLDKDLTKLVFDAAYKMDICFQFK